jgi:hypothetical protein
MRSITLISFIESNRSPLKNHSPTFKTNVSPPDVFLAPISATLYIFLAPAML